MVGDCGSSPCAASRASLLDVFVIGDADGAPYHKQWNGEQWLPSITGWDNLGGQCSSYPCVVSWAPSRLDIFEVGAQDGAQWQPSQTGWDNLGGVFVANWVPCAVSWAPSRLDVFGIGAQGQALYHKAWNGQTWLPSATGWDDFGGVCKSAPWAVQRGSGLLDVFVLG